jgi:hypothetical protein
MEISKAEIKLGRSGVALQSPSTGSARAARRRNPRQGPSGRRRQVHLGLPRWRGAAHLRRVLQAGHHPAHAGAPRAGCGACGRRLRPRHRRRRRGAGHLGPGRHQRRHRHRHGLHGQHPHGDHHRPGADAAIGLDAFQECDTVGITRPIVKHNFLVKDVRDMAEVMKKAFHIARSGRPGPGGGGHPEGRVVQEDALPRLPEDGRDALVQPGAQGPRRPDPQGAAAAAGGQAALHLHRRRRAAGQRLGRAAHAGRHAGLSLSPTR